MSSLADDADIIDRFEEFYRTYYRNEIGTLAQKYPNEQRSLYVDWTDLYRFDSDLADDFLAQPDQMRDYAEEALRLYDLPVDVKLGGAHVRVRNLGETTGIREIRSDHVGRLVAVQGIVRKATGVRPKIQQAAFECQRCGTLTRIPQEGGDFQEPHECQGCERQGPFAINFDQSEFVDSQKIRVQESPEGLRGGETPEAIDVNIEDDITGRVTAGDHVTVTGVLHLEQQGSQQEKSSVFEFYMSGRSVTVEDEQFEEMDITEEDKKDIVELSNDPNVYERMVGSLAPSIYGYDQEKLAIMLQLFSGVRKTLPDGSRIRGDLHILLIGDPGTGKCVAGDTRVTLADGTDVPIRDLVESNLDDPSSVDDGVHDEVDIALPSMTEEASVANRRATRVWKREAPDRMYRIRTASGRELELTPSHPLFVQSGLGPTARPAEELSEGTFVATPRRVPTDGDDSLDVDYRRSRAPNAVRLALPDEWTPWLARLVGYVIAEGHVELRDGRLGDTRITNADREILDDVAAALDRLGLNYTEETKAGDGPARSIRCGSGEFASFLEHLEPAILEKSGKQRVPDPIAGASGDVRRAFLEAYVDAEGHVSASEREITVASMSKELLDGVRSLLLSLGIESAVHPRHNGSHRLRISGEQFVRYAREVGFVTDRKRAAAAVFDDTERNTNTEVVPGVGDELRRIREALELSQHDCGVPRTTYQHYERGDRHPSRGHLRDVLDAFRDRLDELERARTRLDRGDWSDVIELRDGLNVSQATLAARMDVTQRAVSYYERNDAIPDGGQVTGAEQVLRERIEGALDVAEDVRRLRRLVDGDLRWDRIVSIESFEPDDDWVYDLEVEGTHSYLSNGLVSHNSQLLQYVKNLAPRSVYTSGKGSSSAGLCVTGDTLVHTDDGFREIGEIARKRHPEPVAEETTAEHAVGLHTFDRKAGSIDRRESSHVWRMPEKPCRRIETAHGKELEASVDTPLLVCGENGLEWRKVSGIEPGDSVAVPSYDDVDRTEVSVREFLEFTDEKLRLTDDSIAFLRDRLRDEYGTLRDAAGSIGLSEDFIYDSLSNRFLPIDRLRTLLDAVDATMADVEVRRAMLRHGDDVRIPETFDEELLYLLGLVFGDGDIRLSRRGENRGMVRISNGDETLLRRAADIIEAAFDYGIEIEREEDRVPSIRIHSATVARLFYNAGMRTPKDELELDPRLTTAKGTDAFLRGLFDADGSVSVREEGGSSVLLSTISEGLARQVQLMLETYGVSARIRERDRRGTSRLADGTTIESKRIQHFVEIHGRDIDAYAAAIGFESAEKSAALASIVRATNRRGETIPVGDVLTSVDTVAGEYHTNVVRGDNPGRARARSILDEVDLKDAEPLVEEAVGADLRWDEVIEAVDAGEKEVFDLTVPGTHNFLGNGIVTHNTAAAVRDDFSDGQQWTLEAGALVLADQGIAAVDELDKMRCVTGDTVVRTADGEVPIASIAADAAASGTIESLPNGRTIREFETTPTVRTMTDDGLLCWRPVTAVHEYDAPDRLYRVTLETGSSLVATPDHPFFVETAPGRTERPASELRVGDAVTVPNPRVVTDGGNASASDPGAEVPTTATASDVTACEVSAIEVLTDHGHDAVYDLTVAGTHNFLANGMVVHNSEDQSAMHQALEQQEISVSKAGINATLKSRCSLLGAANPIYGRFDEYEPFAEQIDLEPPLISRFDLIFTVTDEPDEEEDRALADHIIETNYAGELQTHRTETATSNVSAEQVESVTKDVEPSIDPDLLRKYVAYAKRNCYPTMTEEAKDRIREFYVDLRLQGQDGDNPVPVTARKLEALVRLAEASARIRLSDTVESEDAERVIEIVRSSLEDVGVDPETGELDADVIESGTSKSQRDRIRNIKGLIEELAEEYDEGAPVEEVIDRAGQIGMEQSKAEHEIQKLKDRGEIYEPSTDHLRTV